MPKKFFVYCLFSEKHNRLYIGQTDNIERRFSQHCSGKVLSTKGFLPYRLIYTEELNTKSDALKREKELKLTKGRRFLKGFIK
jgi:putative endonuclease